jgi:hypothetical protein
MRVCKLRLDTVRKVWLHEPTGLQVTHWDDTESGNRERVHAAAAKMFSERLNEPCSIEFLDAPFPSSQTMTEVRMTNFGGARLPSA